MKDPAFWALAAVAFAGLIGWMLAVWFYLMASKELTRHLIAQQRCTELLQQLVAERTARIQEERGRGHG